MVVPLGVIAWRQLVFVLHKKVRLTLDQQLEEGRGNKRKGRKRGEIDNREKQEIKALSTNDAEEGRGKDNGSKQQEHKGEDEKTTGQETKNMGKGKR